MILSSCACDRMPGISDNISDSERKGLIVKKIIDKPKDFLIMDSVKFIIKEVWIEKMWTHECYENIEIFENFRGYKYQICINTTEESLKSYRRNWELGNSKVEMFRFTSKNSIVSEIKLKDIKNLCFNINQINSSIKSNEILCLAN